jgi:hypothetical protein
MRRERTLTPVLRGFGFNDLWVERPEEISDGDCMVGGDIRLFRGLRAARRAARSFGDGGMTVDWVLVMAAITAAFLAVYLVMALGKPEWFS